MNNGWKMSSSINFRKDTRTLEQFKKDIKARTKKESFLVKLFQEECKYLNKPCYIENNGVDNSGKFLHKSGCQPDYKITVGGFTGLYDIKNSPVTHKWTFKVYHLKQYVKVGANILIFYGTGFIDKNPMKIDVVNTLWGIIYTFNIQKMLEKHKPYKEFTFGNKLCIQIQQKNFSEYLSINRLEHLNAKKTNPKE